jgi:multidrug efflux pump subunit AcrA (membrane-fusion protein)
MQRSLNRGSQHFLQQARQAKQARQAQQASQQQRLAQQQAQRQAQQKTAQQAAESSRKAQEAFARSVKVCLDKCPKNWKTEPTKKADKGKPGVRSSDGEKGANSVRIDKGDPKSSQPSQRVDHVRVNKDGKAIGRDGKPISGRVKDDPENAHIPLSEYKKWETWDAP